MATLSDAIGLALAWEKVARANYLKWAGETKNLNARQLFMNLAKMESKHMEALESISLESDPKINLSEAIWLDLSKDMTSFPTAGDRQLKNIFDYAVSKEESASARYEDLARTVIETALKTLFTRLAAEEKYHKLLLTEQRMRLLKPY
jgi:rubrerythrin